MSVSPEGAAGDVGSESANRDQEQENIPKTAGSESVSGSCGDAAEGVRIEDVDEKIIEESLLDDADSGSETEMIPVDEDILLEEKGENGVVPEVPAADSLMELDGEQSVQENGHQEDVNECVNGNASNGRYEQDYFRSCSIHEIARCSWDRVAKQNHVRGCLWSPDGSCVLTTVNNDGMHVFELPSEMYAAEQVSSDRPVNLLDSAVHVRESTLVYDYRWYPKMHSSVPETAVWIASRQHEPIQMWDAYTGKLRCSYKGYNAVDEVEAALSLAWSNDGELIYGGYKKAIKQFDIKTPGRETSTFPTKVTASCLTACPQLPNLMLFGSWSRSITALVTNSGQTIPVGNNSREYSHSAGVTWLRFIPRTNLFVSGGRKDCKLMLWDIRDLTKPYHVLQRACDTNQRIYFDCSPCGEWIVSGNTDGNMRAWSLLEIDKASRSFRQFTFPLHRDCCNGVSFHPSKPIVATGSGQHHACLTENDADDKADEAESQQKVPENTLILWWIGKTGLSEE